MTNGANTERTAMLQRTYVLSRKRRRNCNESKNLGQRIESIRSKKTYRNTSTMMTEAYNLGGKPPTPLETFHSYTYKLIYAYRPIFFIPSTQERNTRNVNPTSTTPFDAFLPTEMTTQRRRGSTRERSVVPLDGSRICGAMRAVAGGAAMAPVN